MIRTEKRMRLCVTLLICCLVFIWGNSLLPGWISGAISDFAKKILELLFAQGEPGPENGGFLLRKLAHFTEFTALGMCLCWLFGMLGKGRLLPFFAALRQPVWMKPSRFLSRAGFPACGTFVSTPAACCWE